MTGEWKLVIHGGAGSMARGRLPIEDERRIRSALDLALKTGGDLLAAGRSALDAVEAAARVLEDDPDFNAGHGSVFTHDGRIELDAAIMDGSNRAAGAVAAVSRTRNPISLARTVMEQSAHVFLVGAGADAFSRSQGLEQVSPEYFQTAERRRQLDAVLAADGSGFDAELKYGTIGAVAVDRQGNVAAATSTGGLTGKRWNRIGDTPVIGAGTYADNRAGAVSATGAGEVFIRVGAAHEICARIRLKGESAQAAADAVIAEIGALGGTGGVIVVTPGGEAVHAFNSSGMYRGMASAQGRVTGIFGEE